MIYHIIDNTEWLYPDRTDYETSSETFYVFCAKNGYASAQIHIYSAGSDVKITLSGFDAEIYEEIAVPVEQNVGFSAENRTKFYPSRLAPTRVYDCLKPCSGTAKTENGVCALYVAYNASLTGKAGKIYGSITLESGNEKAEIPVCVNVYDVTIPEESLKVIMGCSFNTAAPFHNVKAGTPEYEELRIKYLKMLRRMRQNMLYTDGVRLQKKPDGKYSFDFSELEKNVTEALDLGFKYFSMSGVGFRRSWKASTIRICMTDMDAMSPEAYEFLSQYIPALRNFLAEKGWLERFYLGVADEPNDENALEFKKLCGIIKSFAPDIKLMDALSYNDKLHGALDVWIPLNKSYQEHKTDFDTYREDGSEIWQYVCCGPRGDGYINRFIDYPLVDSRYQFWGNYKYDLKGYLHWAAVCYQPGQNPFEQSCPHHKNADAECTLPAGDTHLIYPGNGEPYMSMRLENHREGIEEYELLNYLGKRNRSKTDALCNQVFKEFNKVEHDMNKFRENKRRLLEALLPR